MCLGVPMRIVEIEGYAARCEARGVERQVNLFLVQHEMLRPGDMVMVHVGNAIQKISKEEAENVWAAYEEVLAYEDPEEDLPAEDDASSADKSDDA